MNKFDITAVEDTVKTILRNLNISEKVLSNRPKSTVTDGDFIVVSIIGSLHDMGAYGECTVGINLYARDANSVKNSKRLSVMYGKLIDGFPQSYGKLEFTNVPTVRRDMEDDFGYHARLVSVSTIIKV